MNKKIKEKRNLKYTNRKIRKKSKKTKAFRLMMRRFFLLLLCLAVLSFLGFGIYFLVCKIFTVKDISVKGKTIYSDSQIVDATKIKKNDSILLTNCVSSETNVFSELPYVEKVKIKKQFPYKIDIFVEAAEPTYSLNIDGEYFVISEHGKILEKRTEKFPELVDILGLNISVIQNIRVKYDNPEMEKLILEIIKSFKNQGLNAIQQIDFSDEENIVVKYDDRLDILLGNKEDIDYKILTAKQIIINKLGAYEKGTLDLKTLKQENRSYFYER